MASTTQGPAKKRRVKKATLQRMSPEQLVARRKKQVNRSKNERRRAMTAAEKRAARKRDTARCYDRERLMRFVRVEPDTGCWVWTGPYKQTFEQARPLVRAGAWGAAYADTCLYVVVTGKQIGQSCYLQRTCGRPECVAPEHLRLSNRLLDIAQEKIDGKEEQHRKRHELPGSELSGPGLCRADDDAERGSRERRADRLTG